MSGKYTFTKFTCYIGYIVQAVINNFLPVLFIIFQDVYSIGYEQLARLVAINFATQIITDLVTPKIVQILGYRRALVLCQGASAFGLALLGILPRVMSDTYLAIIICIVIYAFGSGLIEVLVSPIIEMLPVENKRGSMSLLHSFYCWGQAFTIIVTTLLIKGFGYLGWCNIPLVWSILPFINMFFFMKAPIIEAEKNEIGASLKSLFKRKKFYVYMIMMVCAGASEIGMAQWSSLFAQKALGLTKEIGDIAGPCSFAILMGISRICGAAIFKRFEFKKVLATMSFCCFICYIIVAFSANPIISLIFCAICGFTVGFSWPAIYSQGAVEFPDGFSVMYSVFAMCGDTGCCLGPWILGIVAEKYNLNIGFAAASVFPVIMIFAIFCLLAKAFKI